MTALRNPSSLPLPEEDGPFTPMTMPNIGTHCDHDVTRAVPSLGASGARRDVAWARLR